jgi:hypothetical protein
MKLCHAGREDRQLTLLGLEQQLRYRSQNKDTMHIVCKIHVYSLHIILFYVVKALFIYDEKIQ